jgi:hypothetical protein
MKHLLVNRTSPKGQPFVGTCAACGKQNITFKELSTDECDNVRAMTREHALVEAVKWVYGLSAVTWSRPK